VIEDDGLVRELRKKTKLKNTKDIMKRKKKEKPGHRGGRPRSRAPQTSSPASANMSHHHIITSSHHHIITSSHHHIITSSHHHIIT